MIKAKKRIAETLIHMLLAEDLEDIRIKDLCDRAEVSRMTYYRYFTDKSEILEYYMEMIFDEFMEAERAKPEIAFHTMEHIVFCLEYFRQHGHYASCLYKAGMEGVMLKAINRYLRMNQFGNRLAKDAEMKNSRRAFMLYAYGGAIYNCYMQWVLEEYATDVQTIAQVIYHL